MHVSLATRQMSKGCVERQDDGRFGKLIGKEQPEGQRKSVTKLGLLFLPERADSFEF